MSDQPKLDEREILFTEEEDDVLPFDYSITAYGADYPVDSLVNRMRSGAIEIPGFQRSFVWSQRQASRFIETLLLGLPVPGIFLGRQDDSPRLLVIDGQQRLRTLQAFYDNRWGSSGKDFRLRGVQERFEGLRYDDLDPDTQLRLDDTIIHATIIRQDQPDEDQSSIFHVFERINTGATQLSPQEIRAAIYAGPFNDLLGEFASFDGWRSLYGPPSRRLRDQELVLRFLAMRYARDAYKSPLKRFLNRFMAANRTLDRISRSDFESAFYPTVEVVLDAIGESAFRPRGALNAAVFDSVMYGISKRLDDGPISDFASLRDSYQRLLDDPDYEAAITGNTAQRDVVLRRTSAAESAFAELA